MAPVSHNKTPFHGNDYLYKSLDNEYVYKY